MKLTYPFKPATTWDGSFASESPATEARTSLECSLDSSEVSRMGQKEGQRETIELQAVRKEKIKINICWNLNSLGLLRLALWPPRTLPILDMMIIVLSVCL